MSFEASTPYDNWPRLFTANNQIHPWDPLYATDEFVFDKRFAAGVTSDRNGGRLTEDTRFHELVDLPPKD